MMRIWNFINKTSWETETKRRMFVLLRTLIWFVIPFVVCLVIGRFVNDPNVKWGEYTFLITGYVGVAAGLFGSIFWLYRV